MLFGKKDHLVGLDIGSRTLKMAEIINNKNESILKRFGMIDIAPGFIEEGTVKDFKGVADAIRELIKLYNFKEQNVAISIGGYSVIVKKINVSTMDEQQLQESIQFEAEQYIPFDISEVNLDFQILGENPQNPNQMSVILVAAKKETINDYVNLVQMAGLNPCIIDVDAFALQNIYEFSYGRQEENVALIDIGASKTSLNIIKENMSVFMRDVSLGGGQINEKISAMIDCTLEEAEQIKLSKEPEGLSPAELQGIISAEVNDWCTEIKRALDFFYSTYPEDQIKKIILSGGGANIKEFRDLLSTETSAKVEIINPFGNVNINDDRLDSAYLESIAPQAAICMGLALRRVNDK
jgi:type IV pilus assembly protein PilM